MLDSQDRQYLLERFYTEDLLKKEHIISLLPGSHMVEGVSLWPKIPIMIFYCYTMSGQLAALQTCSREERYYHYHQLPGKPFLPILYGSQEDYELLYKTGEMAIGEGLFDRVALKRTMPKEIACFARLSKGAPKELVVFMKRYAKRVIWAFDMDLKGQEATEKANKKFSDGIDNIVLKYCAKDPSQLVKDKGLVKAKEILMQSLEAQRF